MNEFDRVFIKCTERGAKLRLESNGPGGRKFSRTEIMLGREELDRLVERLVKAQQVMDSMESVPPGLTYELEL